MKITGVKPAGVVPEPDALSTPAPTRPRAPPDTFRSSPVREIALAGSITNPTMQISGMAWHDQTLLLLPQWGEHLYALEKRDVLAQLDGAPAPLTPRELVIGPPDFKDHLPGLEGFEAIAVVGDRAYLLVEAKRGDDMFGYVVPARLGPQGLELELGNAKTLPPAGQVSNMGYEALVVSGDRLLVLPEANAAGLSGPHVGHAFDLETLEGRGEFPMPLLDYRVTDSTPADGDGRFWVANYNHPGDRGMPEHEAHEQLVPLRVDAEGVKRDGAPLTIIPDTSAPPRNWEALARLDDRGFLVMNDEFPRPILGFVAREG